MLKRSYEPEFLDLGPLSYTQDEYEECLIQLERIGRFLGGEKATLKRFSKIKSPLSILDVGCGGGHFTMTLGKSFPKASVLGIDISPQAITFAQKKLKKKPLENVTFSVPSSVELLYEKNSFDIVTCTLVCHHMNDSEIVDFLKRSYQIAKEAIIINDLHRHPIAYSAFALISKPLFPNRLIFHDGLLSIKKAFKKEDWIKYLTQAEIPLEQCSLSWVFPFRWILSIDTSKKL